MRSQKVSHHFSICVRNRIGVQNDFENCLCDRGKKQKFELGAANKKKRAYFKTAEGIAAKKKIQDKAAVKRQILNKLSKMNVK